jgi:hypothetical protein
LFGTDAKNRKCDKKSSKARELQQDRSGEGATFQVGFVGDLPVQLLLLYLSICTPLTTTPLRLNGLNGIDLKLWARAMFVSKLPPKPDFDMLAAAAPPTADRRTIVHAQMGNQIFSWSNNESLFI